jgi:glycosyltransferase involved in cell wall biosynthesis
LVPVKNHRLFLDAAYRVIQKAPDVQFVIVGDGELRFELEQYASTLHLGSNVHFRGFCPNSPEIFADLDVVALTSLNEGTPVTLIEAMAAGKPVVATNVGGVGDLITNGVNGFLVPPNDADAFSEALLRVLALSDDQRIAIIQAGRSSVFPKYDILTATNRMGRLYGSLLRGFGLGSLQT